MSERFCPSGQHYRPLDAFNLKANGSPARDCKRCQETARAHRPKDKFPGVDIDAIHYTLGAIKAAR